jgi:predicted proteasome-type protease
VAVSSTRPTNSVIEANLRATVPMTDRASKHAIPRNDRMVFCLVSFSSVLDSGWRVGYPILKPRRIDPCSDRRMRL